MAKRILSAFLICVILCMALLFSAAGCDNSGREASPDTNAQTTDEPTNGDSDAVQENWSSSGDSSPEEDPAIEEPTDSLQPLDTILPILSVNTKDRRPIRSNEIYLSAMVSASETLSEFAFADLSASIRCRGNYSYGGVPKKSYRLKFDEKVNLFGQDEGKARNWVLLANFTDRSLLRNDTAFAMARALDNIQEVTSSGFVRLYINEKYMGIYQLCEQHSISSHRVNITEQPDVLDSDYLIEMDAYASGEVGVDYFRVGGKNFVVKNDDIHPEALSYLADYFTQVDNAIRSGKEEEISALVDLDSMIDMYLLQEFLRNVDVGWSSFYLVKEAGGKVRFTWPWDFDLAFGNDERLGDATYEGLYAGNYEYHSWENSHPWFYRLMRRQWFVERVCARWDAVGRKMVDAAIARIHYAQTLWGSWFQTNFTVWPILGTDYYPTPPSIARLETYDAAVNQLREWILNRYQWLDEYFSDREAL